MDKHGENLVLEWVRVMQMNWLFALMLLGTSVAAASLVFYTLAHLPGMRRSGLGLGLGGTAGCGAPGLAGGWFGSPGTAVSEKTMFLFDGETLVDANDSGWALLRALGQPGNPWDQLHGYFLTHFPDFDTKIADLPQAQRLSLNSSGAAEIRLEAEWCSGLMRLVMYDCSEDAQGVVLDALSLQAIEDELAALRRGVDLASILIWRQTPDGQVLWANGAYLALAGHSRTAPIMWPLPMLFDPNMAVGLLAEGGVQRVNLAVAGTAKPRWFECQAHAEGDVLLVFALPADAAATAEQNLQAFTQTLGKTFAHLPMGLAIFDRQRKLVLYNPALADLTGLRADFLVARPGLDAFLDRLREERRMPEPKDYKSWRREVVALERSSVSGKYEEIWSLPTGQTFRVTGRPYPDGAMALLIEDISAEITLTRRFRAELDLGQAVLDSLPEAIAVFSSGGILVQSNAAYGALWGGGGAPCASAIGIADAMARWQAGSEATPVWLRIRSQVETLPSLAEWSAEIRLKDGRRMACRLCSLAGGGTLVGFAPIDQVRPLEKLRRSA